MMNELYLFLSFLSGALELGCAFAAVTAAPMSWRVFLLPLAYQAGNLLNRPMIFRTPERVRAAATVSVLAAAALLKWDNVMMRVLTAALASLTLQLARGGLKGSCSTTVKRFWRTLGFFISPIAALFPVLSIGLCTLLPAAVLLLRPVAGKAHKNGRSGLTFAAMICHQMHYFVYTYAVPVFACHTACAWMAPGRALWLASALYTLSWWVYLSPEALAEGAATDRACVRRAFFAGHSFLALVLAVMSAASSTAADAAGFVPLGTFGAAWMLTGLGGGTVFCIKDLSVVSGRFSLPLAEDIGHALGTAAALGIAWLCPGRIVPALTAAACAFVAATLLLGGAAAHEKG